ncbi:MoaD/ThiS family protein [Novosphingobium sp.]|jgi:molybdopterin synthase sulfur carrier subunit|uniref:MoaD/ThiS family protein n=1 Tax=Novosphingobium sp. TaxID=1874826 RepID=UPI0022C2E9D7|nr:MoaD/ThiS family protein [Novosphingobium sp.]MCZ8019803.1 MoaD/ThiS family protein [Novosphingobium sp.]MCZ8035871.1 MoaD/ThiS family protein [Novosphingobium sp.]MCZ8052748.1 MoaD/ThiS family protein [Novosphingobium sp.]MCZ8060853.1 MoaD/ThiS family protein [Novosphingobium sp.]MCZ8233424.1 MoaD/ThiS family protein [Novosphingobium sp.]
MARLVFLGRLADLAGGAELTVAPGPLETTLATLPVELAVALLDERVRIALNGELLAEPGGIVLAEGDELAFLPPVSGG